MKAKRFLFMLLVALMSVTGAWAYDFPDGDFYYSFVKVSDLLTSAEMSEYGLTDVQGVKIVGYHYNRKKMDIVIPKEVTNLDDGITYPVLAIGEDAFDVGTDIVKYNSFQFESGSQLLTIEKHVFSNYVSIGGTITIPASVVKIDDNAFYSNGFAKIEEIRFEEETRIKDFSVNLWNVERLHLSPNFSSVVINSNIPHIYTYYTETDIDKILYIDNDEWTSISHYLHVPDNCVAAYQEKFGDKFAGYICHSIDNIADEHRNSIRHLTKAVGNQGMTYDDVSTITEPYLAAITSTNSIPTIKEQTTACFNAVTTALKTSGYNQGYNKGKTDGINQTKAEFTPTGAGMRLKVTKKDGKVYEFKTSEVQSVDYYRVSE